MSRQLAAIMFTDIVGYTALMGKDEAKAMNILRKNMNIQKSLISTYGGTFLKEMGDGSLASFPTASQAVECALEILQACTGAGIPLRVGMHVGEVIMEGNDVFGDGVNIASRLEQQAPTGGMAVSDSVYANVRNKMDLKFRDSGTVKLKNVEGEMRVYKIGGGKGATALGLSARIWRPALAFLVFAALLIAVWQYYPKWFLDEQTSEISLVVFPFEILGEGVDQSFSDGLQDDILNLLSEDANIKLVSRTSATNFKKSGQAVTDLADQYKVSHVLEGTIRASSKDVRIVAQLINASEDSHLWSTTIEGKASDLLELQASTAEKLSKYVRLSISASDDLPTKSIEALDLYVRAANLVFKRLPGPNEEGVKLARRAIAIDPAYPDPYRVIAWAYTDKYSRFDEPRFWLDSAVLYGKKAVQLAPDYGQAHTALGFALWHRDGPDKAMVELKRGRALGHLNGNNMLGTLYSNKEQYDSAYFYFRESIDARPTAFTLMRIGQLYQDLNLYDSSTTYLEQAFLLDPSLTDLKVELIESSLQVNDYESARQYIDLYLPEDSDEEIVVNTRHMFLSMIESFNQNWGQALEESQRSPWRGILSAYILSKNGRENEAEELYRDLELENRAELEMDGYPRIYLSIAACRLGLQDRQGALELVREAAEGGFSNYDKLAGSLYLSELADDPHFIESLAIVKENRERNRQLVYTLAK